MSTYTPIASQTLSSAAASVTFSGIPQNYTDLIIVYSGLATASQTIGLRFNSDSGSNYSSTRLGGNGSVAFSTRDTNNSVAEMGINYSTGQSNFILHIMNYSNTTTNKTALCRSNAAVGETNVGVGLWRNTAAITSVYLQMNGTSNTFASGSTFNLYGIDAQASAQAKATGGTTIIRDSNYWYHVFTGSGTFTPTQAITADVLVIAGGGAGGTAFSGGGGGAGGLCQQNGRSLSSGTNYSVTIGAGGARLTTDGTSNGSNSTFGAITANGGGGGGYNASSNGASGGSGGGGRFSATAGGAATQGNSDGATGYGNAGGFYSVTSPSGNAPSSGGGGAGAVGGSPTSTSNNGAAGGAGLNTWSSWATATSTGVSGYYAGGGGGGVYYGGAGGAGGAGGGGAGPVNNSSSGSAGVANTGSGGGGSAGYDGGNYGGSGGSGIVIVRYSV